MKHEAEQEGDKEKEDRRVWNAEQIAQSDVREGVGDSEPRRGVGGHVDEPSHDRHRAERRDEWIDPEIGDQPAVRRADQKAGNDGAENADGDAERAEIDHQSRPHDAGESGHRADRKVEAAEDDGEGHAAGDDPDHRVLLQDIDEVLIGSEGRRRNEHAGDKQNEDDEDAVAPRQVEEPRPPAGGLHHAPLRDVAAPVIMLTISSGRVVAVRR